MKTSFYRNLKAFTLCAGFFSLVACKEKSITKAGNLIPPIDNIHTFGLNESFFTPEVTVNQYDTLITNDTTYFYAGLGKLSDDPFFGPSESGLYIQFAPQAGFTRFPAGTVIDSATINLPYWAGITYGDTSKTTSNTINLSVFRVTDDDFKKQSGVNFYAFNDFDYVPSAIGGGVFDLKSAMDTFTSPVDTLSGQLRIPLTAAFINELMSADTTNFATTAAFLSFIKGFYIAPTPGSPLQRRVSYFSLAGSTVATTARIDFHTHNATNQYGKISFPFGYTVCAFSNRIKRNYTGVPASKFTGVSATLRDSVVVQGFPGFYSEITIKNIDQIPPSVINKAQLLLTCLPVGLDNYYTSPTQLIPTGIAADGSRYTIADLLTNSGSTSASGYSFVGGKPAEVTINGTKYIQYAINFPRELQLARNAGKKEVKLRISSATANPGAYRMVTGGPNNTNDTRLRLEVIYTKIN